MENPRPSTPQNNPPAAAAAQSRDLAQFMAEWDRLSLRLRNGEMGGRVQIAILILFILKFIYENFLSAIFVCIIAGLEYRISNVLQVQMSLKSKSSINMLCNLFGCSILLAVSAVLSLFLMGYTENIFQRLSLSPVHSSLNLSFWTTLWNCYITDTVVECFALSLKIFIYLVISFHNFSFSDLGTYICSGMKMSFLGNRC
jgi:hypothetical protein